MKLRIFGAVAVGAILLGAGAANATVQTFTFSVRDPAANLAAGPFGTVTVEDSTGSSNALITSVNQLLFTVDLNDPTYKFRTATGSNPLEALAFNLTGVTAHTFENPVGGVAGGGNTLTFASGSFSESWAGNFTYAIQSQDSSPPPTPFAGPLQFLLTGSGPLTVNSLTANHVTPSFGGTYDVYFTADMINTTNGNTGIVGALRDTITQQGGVPEPATWALMIMGFGGIGATLRRSRRLQGALATA